MTEFGSIFDYQLSAMVFSYATIGFMAAYGLITAWTATHSKSHGFETLQAA